MYPFSSPHSSILHRRGRAKIWFFTRLSTNIFFFTILYLAFISALAGTSSPRYDRDALTYSPDGSIKQLDYAAKSIDRSSLCVGIRCKDNVILAVNKILPRLASLRLDATTASSPSFSPPLEPTEKENENENAKVSDNFFDQVSLSSKSHTTSKENHRRNQVGRLQEMKNLRILQVNENIHILIAGHFSDGKALLTYARTLGYRYKITYGEEIPGKILAEKLASYFYRVSTSADQRPLPNVALLAIKDPSEGASELHVVDTYAVTCQYRACAFGLDSKRVREQLQGIDWMSLETSEALSKLKQLLKEIRDSNSISQKLEDETYEIVTEIGYYGQETGVFEVDHYNI